MVGNNYTDSSEFNRLWGLMETSIVGFCTAYRNYRSSEENIKFTDQVEQKIRKYHIGFIPIGGEWTTEQSDGSELTDYDRSFAVYGSGFGLDDFKDVLLDCVDEMEQDTVLLVQKLVGFLYDDDSGDLINRIEPFRTQDLEKWLGSYSDTGLSYRGKSTMVREPKNRSIVFGTPIEGLFPNGPASIGNHLDVYGLMAVQKLRQRLLSTFRASSSEIKKRTSIIRQIFVNTTYPRHKAIGDLMDYVGMSMGNAESLVEYWRVNLDLIKSITGPRTLQEWRLYKRAKKMHDDGLNYRDAVGILASDAGIMPKRVEEVIGTSEEWMLGYFDFGLAQLKEEDYSAFSNE